MSSSVSRAAARRRTGDRVTDLARGEYIKLVCADDPLYATCLTQQAAVLDENPDVVLVASKRDIVDAQGRVVMHGRGLGGLQGKSAGAVAVRRIVQMGTNVFGEPRSVLMRARPSAPQGRGRTRSPTSSTGDVVRVLQGGNFVGVRRAPSRPSASPL